MVRNDEEHLSHPREEMSKVSLETLRAKLKLFRMVLIIHLTAFERLSDFQY